MLLYSVTIPLAKLAKLVQRASRVSVPDRCYLTARPSRLRGGGHPERQDAGGATLISRLNFVPPDSPL